MDYYVKDIKSFPKTKGVYSIHFKNSNCIKLYIGSTISNLGFYNRWKSHISSLRRNKYSCHILQKAYDKYGEENMIFKIIEECEEDICLIREQYFIDLYDTYNNGYNARKNAENNYGLKHTTETKNKMSKTRTKRHKYSDDVINLYKDNKSTREISKLLNICRNSVKKILSENNIEMRSVVETRKKLVYQYNINGIFIKEYESVNFCSRELNIQSAGIFYVLNGKCSHYKNFYFSYEKLTEDEILEKVNYFKNNPKNIKYKNIKQIDDNDNIVKIWKDLKEIKDILKYPTIHKAVKNKKKYKGYYWKI